MPANTIITTDTSSMLNMITEQVHCCTIKKMLDSNSCSAILCTADTGDRATDLINTLFRGKVERVPSTQINFSERRITVGAQVLGDVKANPTPLNMKSLYGTASAGMLHFDSFLDYCIESRLMASSACSDDSLYSCRTQFAEALDALYRGHESTIAYTILNAIKTGQMTYLTHAGTTTQSVTTNLPIEVQDFTTSNNYTGSAIPLPGAGTNAMPSSLFSGLTAYIAKKGCCRPTLGLINSVTLETLLSTYAAANPSCCSIQPTRVDSPYGVQQINFAGINFLIVDYELIDPSMNPYPVVGDGEVILFCPSSKFSYYHLLNGAPECVNACSELESGLCVNHIGPVLQKELNKKGAVSITLINNFALFPNREFTFVKLF